MFIPLAELGAYAAILDGVHLPQVAIYRSDIQEQRGHKPIKVHDRNRDGFYVMKDGHHRAIARYMEGHYQIAAEVVAPPVEHQWRWPRIVPFLSLLPQPERIT